MLHLCCETLKTARVNGSWFQNKRRGPRGPKEGSRWSLFSEMQALALQDAQT